MKDKTDFRCGNCGRLLARTDGNTEIKCPRCGALNQYNAETGKVLSVPKEKQRVSSSGMAFE